MSKKEQMVGDNFISVTSYQILKLMDGNSLDVDYKLNWVAKNIINTVTRPSIYEH